MSDCVRAAHTTSAPASARACAQPAPMPLPAPVTIATRPSRRKSSRIMRGGLTRLAGERLLDGTDQVGVLRLDQRREALDDLAVAPDQELLEVPTDVAGVAFAVGGGRELLVQRVTTVAVHLDLLRDRELHVVTRRAERADLLGCAGLLRAELVARDADDGEALRSEALVQGLETRVLRGQAALRRHVHEERDLALLGAEHVRLTFERLQRNVVDRHGWPLSRVVRSPYGNGYEATQDEVHGLSRGVARAVRCSRARRTRPSPAAYRRDRCATAATWNPC